MAELNRQVLINLHSDAKVLSDATLLLHGEVAIKHDNVTGATIYTRTTDDKVAKFITDLAVDAKIKPVADDLSAHKTAYGLKMTELENADAANANAITAETQARISADTALDGRITTIETLLGDDDKEGSIMDRLGDVEAVASANTAAIAEEARVRAEEDGKINTELENHDTRITAAKAQADKGVADAAAALAHSQGVAGDLTTTAAAIRKEFADADATLMGKDTDVAGDATIKGALKSAAAAQTAAEGAQATANQAVSAASAAQATADDAKGKIDTFLENADLTEKAIDTLKEIQTYITEDGEAAADMLEAIDANAKAAAAAQKAADDAQDYAEGVAANLEKEVLRAKAAEEANANAITAETSARQTEDAKLLGASGDAASAVTIWGAKNAAAAAQKSADDANDAVEDLEAVTVKAGEIVGVGAEGKSTIVGTFANNKLTFDFGQLVIDCGTF